MQRLIFTNSRGQSVELTNSAPFILQKIEGTGKVDAEIQTSKAPYQDGETLQDVILSMRAVTIEGAVHGADREDMYNKRQHLCSVFNPKLREGVLTYQNDFITKRILAVCDDGVDFKDRYGQNQLFSLSLICSNPFWLDEYKTERVMQYQMGGLMFPLVLPTKFSETTYKRVLTNNGDVETPVEIEFYGPAINPTIRNNSTGEYITVKRTLSDTDKLVISTEFGNKRVEIEASDGSKTNVFNWIDIASTFFQLQVGENELEYITNSADLRSKVIVRYSNKYVGV